jgi:hypothetical protein
MCNTIIHITEGLIIHGKNGPNWPDLEKEKENPNLHGFMISSSR